MALVHGGDIEGFFEERGFAPLDYSSNVSPLGLPAPVREAIGASLEKADQYPDPLCRRLRSALSEHDNLPMSMILCGNGSADLIYRLALASRKKLGRPPCVLIPAPTFSEYAEAFELVDSEIVRSTLKPENNYRLDDDFLEEIRPGVDCVFVCQPNNPTGLTTPRDVVLKALAACEQMGAHLVVDECFVGFLDEPGAVSVVELVQNHPALIVLKAFTKLYGMAGVRLGYVLSSDKALLERMEKAGQPWAVSSIAQAAGITALGCTDYVSQLRALVQAERPLLQAELAQRGIKAQGEANYLYFELDDAGALTGKMRDQGVLVRDCSNYPGLHPGCYRIAVRGHEDNLRLLAALDLCLGSNETPR